MLVGDPGVGKSSLLAAAKARSEGFLVLGACGSEAEAEMSFSALYSLLRPLFDEIDVLPSPQAVALRAAFALGPPAPLDRFTLAVATLGLLASASERQPVLCLLDDLHSFDHTSREAVLFAARRLDTEGVMVLATARRSSVGTFDTSGLEIIDVAELHPEAAADFLVGSGCVPHVARNLSHEVGGNPLVLREIVRHLSPDERSGRTPLPQPVTVGADLAASFEGAYRGLPDDTRRALVLLAASSVVTTSVLASVLDRQGLGLRSFEPAEAADLVELDAATVQFRHAVIRSAVWDGVEPALRRWAHQCLAVAAEADDDVERQAWHLAAAAIGPDPVVAELLGTAASLAASRGDLPRAAAAFRAAARLTAAVPARAALLFASAAHAAGAGLPADHLLVECRALSTDPTLRADALALLLMVELWQGAVEWRPEDLAEAAALATSDPTRASGLIGLLATCRWRVGSVREWVELADRAWVVAGCKVPDQPVGLMAPIMFAISRSHVANTPDGLAVLRGVAALLRDGGADEFIPPAATGLETYGDLEGVIDLIGPAMDRQRAGGALGNVSWLHYGLARVHIRRGELASARADLASALEYAQLADVRWVIEQVAILRLGLDAVQGQSLEVPVSTGHALDDHNVAYALAMADLGAGRAGEAAEILDRIWCHADPKGYVANSMLPIAPDLIAALVRSGSPERAAVVFAEWAELRHPSAEVQFAIAVARCRLLLASDDDLDAAREWIVEAEAISTNPFESARAHLVLGERLRRARRVIEARAELTTAHEALASMGAVPWEHRARAERSAAGDRSGAQPTGGASAELTPQEYQIAALVAEGRSNREVASAVFLSTKTVEMYLSRVYKKLGVRSRTGLARVFASGPPSAGPATSY